MNLLLNMSIFASSCIACDCVRTGSAVESDEECVQVIEQSQRWHDSIAGGSYRVLLNVVERMPPPLSSEEADSMVVEAMLSAVEDPGVSAERLLAAGIDGYLISHAVRVTTKRAMIAYQDGIWQLDEMVNDSWLQIDGTPWAQVSDTMSLGSYFNLEDMVVYATDADDTLTIAPAGSLQHILVNAVILGGSIPSTLSIDNASCECTENRVVASIESMGNTVTVSFDQAAAHRISVIDTRKSDGGRILTSYQYSDLSLLPQSVRMRYYESLGGEGEVLVLDRQIEIELFERIQGRMNIQPVFVDGMMIQDQRSNPPTVYRYRKRCHVTEADRRIVSEIARAARAVDRTPSCGSMCLVAAAILHSTSPDRALKLAMQREVNNQLSLQDLVDVCTEIGIRSAPIRLDPDSGLPPTPAILHVKAHDRPGHFVVALGGDDSFMKISDPLSDSSLIEIVSVDALSERFTGYAIIFR